jgi:hypothetical protein
MKKSENFSYSTMKKLVYRGKTRKNRQKTTQKYAACSTLHTEREKSRRFFEIVPALFTCRSYNT